MALSFAEGAALGGGLGDLIGTALDKAGWTKAAQTRARNDAIFNGGPQATAPGGLAGLIAPTQVAQNAQGMTGANGGGQATLSAPTLAPTTGQPANFQAAFDPANQMKQVDLTRPAAAPQPAIPQQQPAGAFGQNVSTQDLIAVMRDQNSTPQDQQLAQFLFNQRQPMSAKDQASIANTNAQTKLYEAQAEAAKAKEGSYRPATAAEKQAYGVPENTPLVFGPDNKPTILSNGQPTVNVNTQAETQQAKTVGEDFGKARVQFQKDGAAARSQLNTFDAMDALTKDKNFASGAGSSYKLALDKAIVAMGGDPAKTASREAFNALATKSIMEAVGGSLGAGVSNGDVALMKETVPTLDNSPEGIRTTTKIQRAVAQRKIEIARLARDYVKGNGGQMDEGFYQVLEDYGNSHPLFPRGQEPKPLGTGSVSGDIGASAVAPGEYNWTPDKGTVPVGQ